MDERGSILWFTPQPCCRDPSLTGGFFRRLPDPDHRSAWERISGEEKLQGYKRIGRLKSTWTFGALATFQLPRSGPRRREKAVFPRWAAP